MRTKRLLALAIPLLLIAIPAALTYRAVAKARLDHALIADIIANNADAVIADLQHGADPNAVVTHDTPLSWKEVLQNLFRRPTPSSADSPHALLVALVSEYNVQKLRTMRGDTEPDLRIVHALSEAGADANAPFREFYTPLGFAVTFLKPPFVRVLLEHHANVENSGIGKDTPFNTAVERNDFEMAKVLLEHGAKVDVHNAFGTTALIIAVRREDVRFITLLLDHHADVNVTDKGGMTPLDYAQSLHKDKSYSILKKAGGVTKYSVGK